MDPTRTTMLRRHFLSDINRRLQKLSRAVWHLFVEEDAFGLEKRKPLVLMAQQYAFTTDANKLKHFHQWLQDQVNAGLLTVSGTGVPGQPWTYQYVESAYRKGVIRSFIDTNKSALAQSPAWYAGSQAQFLKTAFMMPVAMNTLELLSTRAFEQLKGVTSTMSQQMSRIFSTAMVSGWSTKKTARELQKAIGSISRTRARMLARTEIIHAHAEAQLDGFAMLGVEDLTILAEWSTAGDGLVCDECYAMEGRTFTIDEARGLIPLHPNCRCSWIPAEG